MTDHSRQQRAWVHLFSAFCDEVITPDELVELNALLLDNPVARQRYLEYLDQQANLRRMLVPGVDGSVNVAQPLAILSSEARAGEAQPNRERSPAASPALPRLDSPAQATWRWLNQMSTYSLITAAAILFSVVTLLAIWRVQPAEVAHDPLAVAAGEQPSARLSEADASRAAARVGRTYGAKWPVGKNLAEASQLLQTGQEIELLAGRAEIAFASGALAVIDGPIRLRIDDENRCSLFRGAMQARISTPQSAGFTVVTPKANVIDMGTEFFVAVDERKQTTIAVVDGQVAIEGPHVPRTLLGMGKRVLIDASGRLQVLPNSLWKENAEKTFALFSYQPQTRAEARVDFSGTVGNLIEVGDLPLRVTHLGVQDVDNVSDVHDHDGADGLSGFADDDGFVAESVQVGLWSEDGSRLLASIEIRSSDSLIGSWRYAALPGAGVTLEARGRYLIGAYVGPGREWFLDGGTPLDHSEMLFNAQHQIKLLASRYQPSSFAPPLTESRGAAERWAPANAAYQVITPDPSNKLSSSNESK